MASISLRAAYKNIVSFPCVDGVPLYTRSDGYMDSENRTPKWWELSEKRYNSPNNVRRLIISAHQSVAEMYVSYGKGGVGETIVERVPNTKKGPLHELVTKEIFVRTGVGHMGGVPGAAKAERYQFTSSPLGLISKPNMMSNIEEIYFDLSVMMSDCWMGSIPELNAIVNKSMLVELGQVKGGVISSDIPLQMFASKVGGGDFKLTEVHERFPRLKAVVYISGMKGIRNLPNTGMASPVISEEDLSDADRMYAKTDKMRKLLIEEPSVAQAFCSPQSSKLVIISDLRDSMRFPVKYFAARPMYLLDKEKLTACGDRIAESVKKAAGFRRKAMGDNIKEEADKRESELEQVIMETERAYGEKNAIIAFNIAIRNLNGQERDSVLNSLSQGTRDRYE